jgi:hypothetical protein
LGKKLKIVIVVAIGVVVVLFISVPIVPSFVAPGTELEADAKNNITGVTQFFVLKEAGNLYNIRFSLVNKDMAAVPSDANVTFAAKTKSGDDVFYSREFSVKSQDFQRYRFVITGFPMVAYAWQLNAKDLDKYSAGDFPMAYLNVTLPNGKMFSASTSYF